MNTNQTNTLDPQCRLDVHAQVAARVIDGETLVLLADCGEVLVLNETGTTVWERIDGRHSLAELCGLLNHHYGLPAGAADADVLGFVQDLLDHQALVLLAPAN